MLLKLQLFSKKLSLKIIWLVESGGENTSSHSCNLEARPEQIVRPTSAWCEFQEVSTYQRNFFFFTPSRAALQYEGKASGMSAGEIIAQVGAAARCQEVLPLVDIKGIYSPTPAHFIPSWSRFLVCFFTWRAKGNTPPCFGLLGCTRPRAGKKKLHLCQKSIDVQYWSLK